MNRHEKIISRLTSSLQPTHLNVVNESEAHLGHAGYDGGESHFYIEIASLHLNGLTRIEAHRRIYDTLGDLIPDIHAIRIKIV